MFARFVAILVCLVALGTPPRASARGAARTTAAIASLSPTARFMPTVGRRTVATSSPNLRFGGGTHGNGIEPSPRVYLVFWGRQWGTASTVSGNLVLTNDTKHVAPLLQRMFRGLAGSSDHWSTSTTQYCDKVAIGRVQCGTSGRHVTHPSVSPLAGVWLDSSANAPSSPGTSSYDAAVARAAKHFGNTSAGANASVQYVLATPHGVVPPGFGSQYCGYHDASTGTAYGDLAYVALPYVPDAGSGCGAGFVHHNAAGAIDGVTIVAGHEYAEAVTDPFPDSGWLDTSGGENGDKCAWIASGAGATVDISFSTGTFPMQSLWSNNAHGGRGGCSIYYVSATNQR